MKIQSISQLSIAISAVQWLPLIFMRWDELFADIEAQVRYEDTEVLQSEFIDYQRGQYASVSLADRMRGAIGEPLRLRLKNGDYVQFTLHAVGDGYVGGVDSSGSVLITMDSILSVDAELFRATPPRSVHRPGPPLGTTLRMLSRHREPVKVFDTLGELIAEGTIDRVGSDHFQIASHAFDEFRRQNKIRGTTIIPFSTVMLVRAAGRVSY